jgi:hypothetical protein
VKGGGKAGEGLSAKKRFKKDKAKLVQEALMDQDETIEDVAYMANMSGFAEDVTYMTEENVNIGEDESEQLSWYKWYADLGAPSHLMKIQSVLTDYAPLNVHRVNSIGNESLEALGCGTIELVSKIGNRLIRSKFWNVLYVPRASNNLISISKLDREGGGAQMKDGSVTLHIKGG